MFRSDSPLTCGFRPVPSLSLVRTRIKTLTDFCEGRIVAATNDRVLEIIKLIAMIWLFPSMLRVVAHHQLINRFG